MEIWAQVQFAIDANSKPGAVYVSGLLLAVALSVLEFESFKSSVTVAVVVESSKVNKNKLFLQY